MGKSRVTPSPLNDPNWWTKQGLFQVWAWNNGRPQCVVSRAGLPCALARCLALWWCEDGRVELRRFGERGPVAVREPASRGAAPKWRVVARGKLGRGLRDALCR